MQIKQERQGRRLLRMSAWMGAGTAMLALLVLLLPGMAKAQQSVSADILGTVTDQSGAVIPGAQITVKNVGTGITNTAKSDNKGEYLVQFLQIGNYEVTVDAKGFKKFVAKDIALTAGDRARVDAKMALGAATETVTVSEVAAPALQTDTSTDRHRDSGHQHSGRSAERPQPHRPGADVGRRAELGRRLGSEQRLQGNKQNGGMSIPTTAAQASGYVVNGQSDLNQNNQLDGMDNNDRRIGDVEVKPSIDAIEEVKVQTSLYSAESGRTSGGVVQIVTKSGSNSFKGSLYEYLRNDAFDASDHLRRSARPKLRQNQFGATYRRPDPQEQDLLLRRLRRHDQPPGRFAWRRRHRDPRPAPVDRAEGRHRQYR